MGLFRKKIKKQEILMLSEKDMKSFETFVEEKIGKCERVFHEISSPDLHIDILVIPPSEKNDFYTLVTMGMSVYSMPVPSVYGKMKRAEIAIRLPKDWDVYSSDKKWYWPIGMLKVLARMPYVEKSWLGLYHDVDFVDSFSKETKLCGVLLDTFDDNIEPLSYENGEKVILYNVIPIYRSEMEYKNDNDAEALISKMSEETLKGPVDINRKVVV